MFDRHSRSPQLTTGTQSLPSTQPPPIDPVFDREEQPPAYQVTPVHGLPARPSNQTIDPEDAESVPDKVATKNWSLYVFVVQLLVLFALTIVAFLHYAGTFNFLPFSLHENNFPHYVRSFREVFVTSVAGLGPSAGLGLFLLSLLSIPNYGSASTMLTTIILVALGAGVVLSASKIVAGVVALLLGTIYMAAGIYFKGRVNTTKILLSTIMSNKGMSNNVFSIALMGLFVQIIYSALFSIIVTGYGPVTARANNGLPYLLIAISYISYLWTSLVITNIVYTTTAGVSAAHYLRTGPNQDTPLLVLKGVLTTSLGPISYGSSALLRSIFMCIWTCYSAVKPLPVKYAFYHVVVHKLDFRMASKKVRAQLGALNEKTLLDQLVVVKLLWATAVLAAVLAVDVYWEWERILNVHIIFAAMLASVQIVLTAGAAADAVVDAMFVAMAQDREAFTANQEELASLVYVLSGGAPGELELQAVQVELQAST